MFIEHIVIVVSPILYCFVEEKNGKDSNKTSNLIPVIVSNSIKNTV